MYHYARGLIKLSLVCPIMAYLLWPVAAYPNAFLLPSALLSGVSVVQRASLFSSQFFSRS
ncbi:DUF4400 domain-containing protein [Salmonella enterica]|nr:DUF4400 domain-containing protein [Salmonella enterica]